jgi:hypothetical protein
MSRQYAMEDELRTVAMFVITHLQIYRPNNDSSMYMQHIFVECHVISIISTSVFFCHVSLRHCLILNIINTLCVYTYMNVSYTLLIFVANA